MINAMRIGIIGSRGWIGKSFTSALLRHGLIKPEQLTYMAGLIGSGPAFAAMLADAPITHAIHRGLEKAFAVDAVQTLLEGAGQLIGSRPSTPAEIVEQFVAYRGTTTAALEAMRDAGFAVAIAAGVEAAERRGNAMNPSA